MIQIGFGLGQSAAEPVGQVFEFEPDAYVEAAEEGVLGADFVEAHLVDEALENDRIVGEEVNGPLPVIETDGAGDDLADFVGVAAADHAVFVHHALAVRHGFHVPVDVFAALAIHGIEAGVLSVWDGGVKAGGHGSALAIDGLLDGGVPFRGVGLDVACGEGRVGFGGGLVEAELDSGEIGIGGLEVIGELGLGEVKLDAIEIFDGVAQVNEHEVALVAEERVEDGLMGLGGLICFGFTGGDGELFEFGDGG